MVERSTLSLSSRLAARLRCRRWLLVALLCAGACASDPPAAACGVVGRERSCPCEGHAVGIQACQMDGQWEACTCYALGGAGGATERAGASGAVAGASGAAAGISGSSAGRGGATGQRASGVRGAAGFPFPWRP